MTYVWSKSQSANVFNCPTAEKTYYERNCQFLDQLQTPYHYSPYCSSCFCCGWPYSKNLKAQPLQIGSGWKSAGMLYLSNDGIGFLILRHTLKMAVMTSARICIRSQQRPPPASRAHVTSLARCIRYSPWSIVHSYLLFSYHYDLFFSSCKHNKEQESLAIAKMTARCALYIPISYSP